MTSPGDRLSSDATLLLELTGAPQAWLALCQEVIAARAAPALVALIEDETGPWARALRTGREVRDTGEDLSLEREIFDVRAAHALRRITAYLAGLTGRPIAESLAPIVAHADDAQLHSTNGCDIDRMIGHLQSLGRLSKELEEALRQLHGCQRPSAAFVALLVCHLTRNLQLPARPGITVPVLFDVTPRDGAVSSDPGAAGRLSLTLLEHGPPGLHPDPRRMAFFYSPTPAFGDSLRNAWNASPFPKTSASVCWAVTLDVEAEGPANTIEGGSLGGAFGLALHELHTKRTRRLNVESVPGLRNFYLDFRPRITNPRTAVTATVTDSEGNLGPVTGLDNKVAAARRAHVDLVIAHPHAIHASDSDSAVAMATALTVREAVRHARTAANPRFLRTLTVVLMVGVLAVTVAASIRLVVANNEREQRRVAAEQLLREAVAVRQSNPRLALQLGEAAVVLSPSSASRASLTETLANSHFAGNVTESGGVQALAVDRSGRLLADATEDNRLSLWRLNGSVPPIRLGAAATSSPVRTLAVTPDGQTLVTGDTSNCIAVWDITSTNEPRLLPWRDPSPAARCGSVEAADTSLPKIQDLAVSRGGQLLAAASSDGTLTLLDVSVPARPRRLSTTQIPGQGVWSVAFDPHRDAIITGSADGTITAWSIADARSPHILDSVRHEHADIVRSIAFQPTGRSFVTGSLDNTLKVWDASDLRHLHVRKTLRGHSGDIFRVAYATDGQTFVSASADRTAIVWNAESLKPSATLRGQDGYLRALAFIPGAERVITGSLDGTIMMWELAAPSQVSQVPPVAREPGKVRSIVFSPDYSEFATGTSTGVVQIYDASQPGQRPITLPRASGSVYSLAWSSDNELAEGGSSKDQVQVWDVRERDSPALLWRLSDDYGAVHAVAFDPTGQLLASGNADGTVALWRPSVDQTAPISAGRSSQEVVTTVAFGGQGRLLASGGIDKAVTIWPATQPGRIEPLSRIRDHDEAVYAVQYSQDGRLLAVSSADASTTLWSTAQDPTAPSRLSKIIRDGQTRRIRAEAFSPDGGILAIGGDEGTVDLFALTEPTNPRLLGTLSVVKPVPSSDGEGVLALAYGRHTLAVAGADGDIRSYDMSRFENIQLQPREVACSLTVEGLDQKAWAVYVRDVPYEATCDR